MWATLKHFNDDAISLMYVEGGHQEIHGHYSKGVMKWNDNDRWEKKHEGGHHDKNH